MNSHSDDIKGAHYICIYIYIYSMYVCIYITHLTFISIFVYILLFMLLLCVESYYSINYIYIWVLVSVIKRNVFTNWLARNVPWTRYFWKHVFHIKIYQPGKYLGVPEVVIYGYSLDCYWCIRWWGWWRLRNSKWCPNNKITPRPTGNMKLTLYLVIKIVTLL